MTWFATLSLVFGIFALIFGIVLIFTSVMLPTSIPIPEAGSESIDIIDQNIMITIQNVGFVLSGFGIISILGSLILYFTSDR